VDPANRDKFSHISHTFTHESEDNATYFDVYREISWNQAWLAQAGLEEAVRFSSIGIIPPAITGLHNGDALRAWSDCGIINVVGDNTRPALLNTVNEHWPLISTVEGNGFAGIQIIPRWATNIYFNCDTTECDVQEWIDIAQGAGTIDDLLELEKSDNVRNLLSLHHDPFMFHQGNLRHEGVSNTTINGVTGQYSLLQMWVETMVQEFTRLVTWPLITLPHDQIAATFARRMQRDNCNYGMTYQLNPNASTITGILVTADNNTCATSIPITVPGPVTGPSGFVTEHLTGDPLTIWVNLNGAPVFLTLKDPIAW